MPRVPTPEEEVECFLLTMKGETNHKWVKEEITRWIARLKDQPTRPTSGT